MKNHLKEFAEEHFKGDDTVAVFAFILNEDKVANYCIKGMGPQQFVVMSMEWLKELGPHMKLTEEEKQLSNFLQHFFDSIVSPLLPLDVTIQ